MADKSLSLQKKEIPSPDIGVSLLGHKARPIPLPVKWIAGVSGLICTGALFFLVFVNLEEKHQNEAWSMVWQVSQLSDKDAKTPLSVKPNETPTDSREKLKKAAKRYEEVIVAFPKTDAVSIARFESGNIYFQLEEYAAAEKHYTAFLQRPHASQMLAAITHLKLGYLKQRTGQADAAMAHFKKAHEMEGSLIRDQSGYELGRLLEQAGRKAEATHYYKNVSDKFEKSPWGFEAKTRLLALNPAGAALPDATGTPSSKEKESPSP